MKKLIIISLGIFITTLLVVAIVWSTTTGRSLDECFFGACCGILYLTGKYLGFTYKEICVIVNIYLEAGLCLLSALWVTWATVKFFTHRKTIGNGLIMTAGGLYSIVYIGGFMWLCQHYAMPLNDAFDLCYRELIQLAKDCHTTYNNVNYAIFIIIFLVITIGNILLVKLLETSQRHYNPYQPDNCK
jgi:hypothetical protein